MFKTWAIVRMWLDFLSAIAINLTSASHASRFAPPGMRRVTEAAS